MQSLLGASAAPTDGGGAPPLLTALVLLALAVGVGWWLFRMSTQRVGDELPPLHHETTDDDPLAPSEPGDADVGSPSVDVPTVVAPTVDLTERPVLSMPDQVAALDQALTSGSITTDEHRVLLTALLEGSEQEWARPGPVPPPTE